MEKLKLHSPDLVQSNVARIADLFPNCVTESRDDAGNVKQAIDFDLLRQELSDHVVEGPRERYHLDWPGKREALLAANAPIAKTFRPCRQDSVNFDTTKNLFIEGDNLDALKLLQESYLGKVKLIYIDPPYNTGKDFIYDDDFAESAHAYKLRANEKDEEGSRLTQNTSANGRFHSDWLSMIYSRLKLARNMLADDGVILISIDEHEVDNLRKVCIEVFGENNFIASLVWVKKEKASGVPPKNMLLPNFEYVVAVKRGGEIAFKGQERSLASYKQDKDGRWWRTMPIQATGAQNSWFAIADPATGKSYFGNWAFSEQKIQEMIKARKIQFPKNDDGKPVQIVYADEMANDKSPIFANLGRYDSETSTKQLIALMGGKKYFDFPKPLDLLVFLVDQLTCSDDIVVDFFAGSCTTAHAVMQLNARDGGKRRFIMVQLPESTPEDSEAHKDGFGTIADIGKERVRRAGKRIKQEAGLEGESLDIGFRVLSLDSSNIKDVYYRPDSLRKDELFEHLENIKQDRTAEDLLFQVLLDWGLDLNLPISEETIDGKTVFIVDENAMAACFDTGVTEELVKKVAARRPLRVVFRDAGFSSDSVKINIEQVVKLLSPGTEIRAI